MKRKNPRLTLFRMALLAPQCRMAKIVKFPCSDFSPADQKTVSTDINKMSKSQELIDTK
jgi:hypothetical protein